MLVNKDTAISTPGVVLVPYEPYHVDKYHSWMADEELQKLTASEPLSLEEEFAMQKSWRADGDKLTFIICKPFPPPHIYMGMRKRDVKTNNDNFNSVEQMIGDINLFLTQSDVEPEACVGELELMIAREENRHEGYGTISLYLFLEYIEGHMSEILSEFKNSLPASESGAPKGDIYLQKLRAQIDCENTASIGLFQKLRFYMKNKEPNYFGEVEMVHRGFSGRRDDGTWSYPPRPVNELPFVRLKVEDNVEQSEIES